jgi:hypothetical protein
MFAGRIGGATGYWHAGNSLGGGRERDDNEDRDDDDDGTAG